MPSKIYSSGFLAMLLLFIFSSCSYIACAQASKTLHFTIKLDAEDKNWDNIKVTIQDDSGIVQHERGSMFTKLVLPFQQKYSITFTKPGTKAKHIDVDTHVPTSVARKKMNYTIRVLLYNREQGEITFEEKALECKTEVTVFYNMELGAFDYRR